MQRARGGGGAAIFFFLALASPVVAEPITKATAATAINAAYAIVLSFIVSSQLLIRTRIVGGNIG
jgi:hypothetical protein